MSAFASGHPYSIVLTKGDRKPGDVGLCGLFLVDADCALEALNDPWLETHMRRSDPLIFAFQRAQDLAQFKRKLWQFQRRGYRVTEESHADA